MSIICGVNINSQSKSFSTSLILESVDGRWRKEAAIWPELSFSKVVLNVVQLAFLDSIIRSNSFAVLPAKSSPICMNILSLLELVVVQISLVFLL